MVKAISLLSGGLDSILATKLILDQGIEVEAVNFKTVFCNCTPKNGSCMVSKTAAETLGIKLKVFEVSREYFEVIKNPKHGYGKNINPCIDCRIFMFKKAKEYMEASGASFVITGEVLGERPMSQRKNAIGLIERESGLEGLIVRPLSARLFSPSIPEKEGLVDREKFLSIEGRCRKPQINLAKDLSINDYPCPSGGCLLTYEGFANKMRDLIKYKPNFTINDVELLKTARYFRLGPKAMLFVGRDQQQNIHLDALAKENDIRLQINNAAGPVGIGRGEFTKELIDQSASIVARYSDHNGNRVSIGHNKLPDTETNFIEIYPAEEAFLSHLRV